MPLTLLRAEVLEGTFAAEFLPVLPCFQVQFSHFSQWSVIINGAIALLLLFQRWAFRDSHPLLRGVPVPLP